MYLAESAVSNPCKYYSADARLKGKWIFSSANAHYQIRTENKVVFWWLAISPLQIKLVSLGVKIAKN